MNMMEVTHSIKHEFLNKLSETSIGFEGPILSKAKDALSRLEIPTTRNEKWKYTRLGKIKNSVFQDPVKTNANRNTPSIAEGPKLVFVNGHYDDSNSDISNTNFHVDFYSQSNTKINTTKTSEQELFDVINAVYLHECLALSIGKNKIEDKLVQIVLDNDAPDQLINFRLKVKAEEGSQSKICIVQTGNSNSFTNLILEVDVEENANLTIYLIQKDTNDSKIISSSYVDQGRNSTFEILTVTLSGLLVRNNLNIRVNGEGSQTNLYGSYLLNGNQHVDNHTIVDHRVAHCDSNELYKGVMNDKSTAVFNGKVFVRQDAQKTNAFQSNGNVLLSDDASINSKPELEIYADDVKCSHGSTTGQLDEEAIYYLRTRGISEENARNLLITAFIGEVMECISDEDVKTYVKNFITDKFGWQF